MALAALNGVDADTTPPVGDAVNALAQGVVFGVGPLAPSYLRGTANLSLWASYSTSLTTVAGSLSATLGAAGNVAVGSAVNSANVPPGTTVAAINGTTVTLALPTMFYRGKVSKGSTVMAFEPDAAARLVGATVSGYGIQPGTTVLGYVPPPPGLNPSGSAPFGSLMLSLPATLDEPVHATPFFFGFALGPAAITAGVDLAASFAGATITSQGSVQLERSFDGGATYIVGNIGSLGALAVFNAGGPITLSFSEMERNVLYRLNCTSYTAQSGVTLNYRLSQNSGAAESLSIN